MMKEWGRMNKMKNKKDEAPIEFEYTDDENEEEIDEEDEEDNEDEELEESEKDYEGVEIIESVVDNKFIDLMINALKELKKSEGAIEIDLDDDTVLRLHHEDSINKLNDEDEEDE